MTKRKAEANIELLSFPIRDCDRDSLTARLYTAVHVQEDLVRDDGGRNVYIRGTAGISEELAGKMVKS